jgi:hypothetical protein
LAQKEHVKKRLEEFRKILAEKQKNLEEGN